MVPPDCCSLMIKVCPLVPMPRAVQTPRSATSGAFGDRPQPRLAMSSPNADISRLRVSIDTSVSGRVGGTGCWDYIAAERSETDAQVGHERQVIGGHQR